MTSKSDPDRLVPIPVFWLESATRSFVDVPVSGARFCSIELQQIGDEQRKGHLVTLHRPSGELELYVERSIDLDQSWFDADPAFAHFELAHFEQTDFAEARCHVAAGEIDAVVRFTDDNGDELEMQARFGGGRPSEPLFTPAPLQSTAQNLRFLTMNEFRLLPTRRSQVSVAVNGKAVTLDPFLIPSARLAPFLEARGASGLLLFTLLPPHEQRRLETAGPGRSELADGTVIEVGPYGLRTVGVESETGYFTARFDPALPNIQLEMSTALNETGQLTISSSLGTVATGQWQLRATANGADFELTDVVQDWFPGLDQPSRLVLQQIRKLRRRNQHWHYRALLERDGDGGWISTGSWSP